LSRSVNNIPQHNMLGSYNVSFLLDLKAPQNNLLLLLESKKLWHHRATRALIPPYSSKAEGIGCVRLKVLQIQDIRHKPIAALVARMGETSLPVTMGFNRSLRFESRVDRLTGDPGAVLLRETVMTDPVHTYRHYREVPESAWHWPNFSLAEISCRGTDKLLINAPALDKLQALRDRLGKPLILRSAYRSQEHNRAVDGAPQSKHMNGTLFDIAMSNHDPVAFEAAARAVGFLGFGFYPRSGFYSC
jgi:hypothetical protein